MYPTALICIATTSLCLFTRIVKAFNKYCKLLLHTNHKWKVYWTPHVIQWHWCRGLVHLIYDYKERLGWIYCPKPATLCLSHQGKAGLCEWPPKNTRKQWLERAQNQKLFNLRRQRRLRNGFRLSMALSDDEPLQFGRRLKTMRPNYEEVSLLYIYSSSTYKIVS